MKPLERTVAIIDNTKIMNHVVPTFPIEELPARNRAVPVVLSVPHSGVLTPDEERAAYAVDPDDVARRGDLYVDALYDGAVDLGITVVRTPYSRFLVDLNRLPDDFSAQSVIGTRARNDSGYHGTRGVLWAVTPDGRAMYHQPFSRSQAGLRLERYYYPYHRALRNHLQDLRNRFGYAILIDAHSMPSHVTSARKPPRADIVPGDLNGRSCAEELSTFVEQCWALAGYSVEPNKPYRGGAITRMHGRPHEDIHAIQIELNRALYMDERTYGISRGFEQLRKDCLAFLQGVVSLNLADANAAE